MRAALIFDFDGLVIDTESTDFASWQSVYDDYGHVLPRERWQTIIGTNGAAFDPLRHLQELTGRALDEAALHVQRRERLARLVDQLVPLPGVTDWIEAARARGFALAVASSSPRSWVEGHLERIGLRSAFALLMTADQVARVKPDPELYHRTLHALDVAPERAVALEDSPHGVAAAKGAGLFCVAVPGPMTRNLAFDGADLVLESLAHTTLSHVLRRRELG